MNKTGELLVVSPMPELLRLKPGWFAKNGKKISGGRHQNPFWRNNSFVIKQGPARLRDIAERLIGMGYTACQFPCARGEFALKGGSVIIIPANSAGAWRIEFYGNNIDSIEKLSREKTARLEKKEERALASFLQDGDFVVHRDHGIGIWRGAARERGRDFFLIEYGGPRLGSPDSLLVPATEENRITPYIGFRAPRVSRLGTPLWRRTLKQTKHDAREFARKLLALYAERALKTRAPYRGEKEIEDIVASSFKHTETPSQKKAIKDIFCDLESEYPMDRLVVGDVGFGKTELALRASVRVAASGFQAAILAPTTLLADQHYITWSERAGKTPLNIARLTRLDAPREIKKTIAGLRDGKIDIAIGTHRMLSGDVAFKKLGLVVIDEEQRFGVRAKEQLKNLMAGVDVLTMSATPLPRTLSFALARIKTMSVLSEAPHGRLAPKTYNARFNEYILRRAIEKEINRSGQLYILEPRIRNIQKTLKLVEKLVPSRRVAYLHGRMGEAELSRTMEKFRAGKIEILVSTTIIENGIDLANVNTLVVTDATKFGLAQLHQLRGRIGRGSRQAYAYFFWPMETLPDKARGRLSILLSTQFLGAGQYIAERDLDIRGAGNILGREQSGAARAIGFNLYAQFLAEAIEALNRAGGTGATPPR